MRFGASRTEVDSSGEYKAIDVSMSRREFRAFAYVVEAEVLRNPPKPDEFSLANLARDGLVEALAQSRPRRFRTVVTVPEGRLDDMGEVLTRYPEEGAIHSIQGGVDPTMIPDIAQRATAMAQQITAKVAELEAK